MQALVAGEVTGHGLPTRHWRRGQGGRGVLEKFVGRFIGGFVGVPLEGASQTTFTRLGRP